MIKLESDRLILRDHISSDLEAMHSWISDPEIMEYLDWKTNSIEETSLKLKESIDENFNPNRKKYFFAVVQKKNDKVIGDAGFTILSKNDYGGVAECGFFIQKKYWGIGIATEAISRINAFAFNDLGLHKMTAGCDAENKASERVMIKCGMTKEAEFKKHHFHRNKWGDRLKYALQKDEWVKLIK